MTEFKNELLPPITEPLPPNDLIKYVEDLDNFDEKNPIINQFIDKLKTPIDYQKLLDKFNWGGEQSGSSNRDALTSWFAELDELLLTIGYCGRDDIIAKIKEFLLTKLKNINIVQYNKIFSSGIWNHIEFLAQNPEKIDWYHLSDNTVAIELIKANQDKINWKTLSSNSAAIDLLEQNLDKVCWYRLSRNGSAIHLLRQNPDKIDWYAVSTSNDMIELVKENPDKINWNGLSLVPAIEILKANQDEINWSRLSRNSGAMELLKANPDKIDWQQFSSNSSAIDMLADNLDKVDWRWLCFNENAGPLLMKHIADCKRDNIPDKINWNALSMNSGIIDLITDNLDKINWWHLSVNQSAMEIIKANLDNVSYDNLCKNIYDYYREKRDHFNSMGLFPRSHLEL